MAIVLASASPRRAQLLKMITEDFEIIVSDTDESLPCDFRPEEGVAILALRKASSVFQQRPKDIVIGADTVVALQHTILGKPKDRQDAVRMLGMLQGTSHWVHTGVAVLSVCGERSFVSSAKVTFSPMSRHEIDDYVCSGECDDKAGAYAVQGLGSRFVEQIAGDFYTVMGLPVNRLYHLLNQL